MFTLYCKECDVYMNYIPKDVNDSRCIHTMMNYEVIEISIVKYLWLKLKGKIYE